MQIIIFNTSMLVRYVLVLFFCLMIGCAESISQHPSSYYKGIASWYGPKFHGKKTASGEIFNMYDYTAAHRYLPFNTKVCVRNLLNNKTVIVRINDRGPFVKNRIIDLSYAAAKRIDLIKTGTAPVEIKVLSTKIYYVQAGCFSNKNNAINLLNKFKSKGFSPFIFNKGNFWCVRIGPYFSQSSVLKAINRIKRVNSKSFIISID